jgi:hypothetical protein
MFLSVEQGDQVSETSNETKMTDTTSLQACIFIFWSVVLLNDVICSSGKEASTAYRILLWRLIGIWM